MRTHAEMENAFKRFGFAMEKKIARTDRMKLNVVSYNLNHNYDLKIKILDLDSFFLLLLKAPNKPGDRCNSNEFECKSRNQCILKGFLCDGQTDCKDNSDEIGCGMW